MHMKELLILGTGCDKCERLEKLTREAGAELDLEFSLRKVGEINDIIGFGVMVTPALVVDGDVKCVGKVPSVEEIKEYLS